MGRGVRPSIVGGGQADLPGRTRARVGRGVRPGSSWAPESHGRDRASFWHPKPTLERRIPVPVRRAGWIGPRSPTQRGERARTRSAGSSQGVLCTGKPPSAVSPCREQRRSLEHDCSRWESSARVPPAVCGSSRRPRGCRQFPRLERLSAPTTVARPHAPVVAVGSPGSTVQSAQASSSRPRSSVAASDAKKCWLPAWRSRKPRWSGPSRRAVVPARR